MNTELIDYIKTLAKKEFFFVSFAEILFSLVILVCGVITLRAEPSTLLYTIMFASATVLLGLNSYRCYKRGTKNVWFFAAAGVIFAAITGICVYALIGGY